MRNMAADWLRKELDDLQEHPVSVLREMAKEAGVGSWKTVQRAAQEMGVISQRASFGGGYIWRLPKPAPLQDSTRDTPLEKERTCPPVPQGETSEKTEDSAGQVPLRDKSSSVVPHGENGDPSDDQIDAEHDRLEREGMRQF
jgi:hypothetical protein